jgi:riboflavin kinase/FMN adenylyltransferase
MMAQRQIHWAIEAGDVEVVLELTGQPFSVRGEVVVGNQLGRTIGVPTANLADQPRAVVPAKGVYASVVTLDDGSRWPGATNVGVRPTVTDDGAVRIETHLIGFDGDLYGMIIEVAFLTRLRGERRFAGLEQLKEQLALDITEAQAAAGEWLDASESGRRRA